MSRAGDSLLLLNIAAPAESDCDTDPPRHRAKKDRRRWCKGKPGVEHDWGAWYVAFQHIGCLACRVIERRDCQRCGKKQLRTQRVAT